MNQEVQAPSDQKAPEPVSVLSPINSRVLIPHPDEKQVPFTDQDVVLVDRNKYEEALEELSKLRAENEARKNSQAIEPLTLEDIRRIEDYTNRATAGPWQDTGTLDFSVERPPREFVFLMPAPDAEFIAQIRTDAPKLCATVRHLNEENEALTRRYKAMVEAVNEVNTKFDETPIGQSERQIRGLESALAVAEKLLALTLSDNKEDCNAIAAMLDKAGVPSNTGDYQIPLVTRVEQVLSMAEKQMKGPQ